MLAMSRTSSASRRSRCTITAVRGSPPPAEVASSVTNRQRPVRRRCVISEEHRQPDTKPRGILLRLIDSPQSVREQIVEVEDDVRGGSPGKSRAEEIHRGERIPWIEVLVAADEGERVDDLLHALDVEAEQVPARRIAPPEEEFPHQLPVLATPQGIEPGDVVPAIVARGREIGGAEGPRGERGVLEPGPRATVGGRNPPVSGERRQKLAVEAV